MTTENAEVKTTDTDQTTDTVVDEKQEASTPTLSAKEEKAIAQGWKPKEEWVAAGGDPDEWRGASEFLDRGEFMRHISAQNKQIRDLLEAQKALTEHNRKLAEAAAREELTELRARKKAALEENDAAAVVAIEEAIDETKDKLAEAKAAAERENTRTEAPVIHPDFQKWSERNSWYNQNAELRDYADVVGTRYAKENPGTPPHEVLAFVERKVKTVFKDQFTNPNREKPSAVEAGTGNRKASTSKADDYELSPVERQVMNTFVKQGLMTEAEYIKQLKAANRR